MSKASIQKEVRILQQTLAPEKEPEWKQHAREIDKALREYEAVVEQIKLLSPSEQAEMLSEVHNVAVQMTNQSSYDWAFEEVARLNLAAQKAEGKPE